MSNANDRLGARWYLWAALALTGAATLGVRYKQMAWPFSDRFVVTLPAIPRDRPSIADAASAKRFSDAHERLESDPLDPIANGTLGMLLHAHGMLEGAEACYRRATALEPACYDWWYYLGRCLAKRGATEEAIDVLQAAVDGNNSYLPGLLALAELYLSINEPAKGRRLYQMALERDGSCAAAYWGLGCVASLEGDEAGVQRNMRRALELRPDFGEARYALAMSERGDATAVPGKQAQRIHGVALRNAVADPLMGAILAMGVDASADVVAGLRLHRVGRFGEAVPRLQQALASRPDDAQLLFKLAQSLEGIGEFDLAVEAYERAAVAAPAHAGVPASLADLQSRLGRMDEAIRFWRESLRLDAGNQEVRKELVQALLAAGRRKEAQQEIIMGMNSLD
ncbi:MAG: tetratricopeptide repeat protein [Planctomycetota bacterium]|nr:tetratricopeptide repeat protein [Planctomycetota bacterium]